jgi:hypothetical protein
MILFAPRLSAATFRFNFYISEFVCPVGTGADDAGYLARVADSILAVNTYGGLACLAKQPASKY